MTLRFQGVDYLLLLHLIMGLLMGGVYRCTLRSLIRNLEIKTSFKRWRLLKTIVNPHFELQKKCFEVTIFAWSMSRLNFQLQPVCISVRKLLKFLISKQFFLCSDKFTFIICQNRELSLDARKASVYILQNKECKDTNSEPCQEQSFR